MSDHTVFMVSENAYPIKGGGGLEYQITTISKYLISQGVKVRVISPMMPYVPQVKHDVHEGINVYRISYPRIPKIGAGFMLFYLAIYLVRHRNEFNALHCHAAHNAAAIACLVGRLIRKPVIVKLTGWWEREKGILKDSNESMYISLLRWATRKATYYQVISSQLARLLVNKGYDKNKIKRIPNAIDTSRFQFNEDKKVLKSASKYNYDLIGVFVGRLVAEKGLDILVDAWMEAFAENENVALIIVGDGKLKEELELQVKAGNRSHQILFPGASENVKDYLGIADFGLLPSIYEGLSNTLLEYMSSGLPVIGSRISGTEDVIMEDENGWMFSSRNSGELVECLKRLKSKSPEELCQMGKAARQFIQNYADIESVADKLTSLYGIK